MADQDLKDIIEGRGISKETPGYESVEGNTGKRGAKKKARRKKSLQGDASVNESRNAGLRTTLNYGNTKVRGSTRVRPKDKNKKESAEKQMTKNSGLIAEMRFLTIFNDEKNKRSK